VHRHHEVAVSHAPILPMNYEYHSPRCPTSTSSPRPSERYQA